MCVSTKEMSVFGDLICRPSSSCPQRSPFSAKARFACGRFAGAPLELTLLRIFPSRVVPRSICFVRSKQARTTTSSAPRFAAKRSTSASFSHESSRQNQLFRPFFNLGIGGAMAHRFQPPGRCLRSRAPLTRRGRALSQCPQCASWHLRAVQAQYKSSTSPVQVQYKSVLGGAARLDFPDFDLLRVLYVPFV